jgi:hypothetical protein
MTLKPTTCFLITANAVPGVNAPTALSAQLVDGTGKGIAGKKLTIAHTLNGAPSADWAGTTDKNGWVQFTQKWTSKGIRPYSVSFAGDSTYSASKSGLCIDVGVGVT